MTFNKSILTLSLFAFMMLPSMAIEADVAVQPVAEVKKEIVKKEVVKPICASSLDIIEEPAKYLNKDVKVKATFDKFSTLGLDYKPAFKDSKDYITILIKRDDVKDHTIPLSELKLFVKREIAEKKLIDLETGDKIEFDANVFSNALGDAWAEIQTVNVVSTKKPKTAKK